MASSQQKHRRSARIAVLLAANAAALVFAWHLIAGRAKHAVAPESNVAAAAPANVAVVPDLPHRTRDAELEGRIRAVG